MRVSGTGQPAISSVMMAVTCGLVIPTEIGFVMDIDLVSEYSIISYYLVFSKIQNKLVSSYK